MLNLNDTLYFSTCENNKIIGSLWERIFNKIPWEGQWYLKIHDKINPNRLVTRNGVWTTPWPQDLIPKFSMPAYDPSFSKTFEEVTDENALRIRNRIHTGERFAVMWSGGIDSTVVLVSLLKNLTQEELKNVTVMCNLESVIENPTFYKNFVHNKIDTLDSGKYKYDDMIALGLTPITADEGDCIFGTLIGLGMYNNFDALIEKVSAPVKEKIKPLRDKISDPNIHYSNFKEIIIQYFNISWDERFGRIFYDKLVHNIETSDVPVHSLHDFFWWFIFNVKYFNCSVRGAIYYNDTLDCKTAIHRIVNWYNDEDYQRWSMANNNNGEKIKDTILSYKAAAKDYIYKFDNNIWYRTFKTKIISLNNIASTQSISRIPEETLPKNRVAIKKDNWELIYSGDPSVEEYFTHHLSNYKIDWSEL